MMLHVCLLLLLYVPSENCYEISTSTKTGAARQLFFDVSLDRNTRILTEVQNYTR